jgi:hypothetical protein
MVGKLVWLNSFRHRWPGQPSSIWAAPHLKLFENNKHCFGDAATPAQEAFFLDVLMVQNHPFEHYRES